MFCLCTRCCLNTSRATTHLILITALRNRCPPLCKLGSRATQRLNNLSEVAHLIRSRSKGYNVRGRRTLSVYCQGILELVEAANPVNFTSLFYRWRNGDQKDPARGPTSHCWLVVNLGWDLSVLFSFTTQSKHWEIAAPDHGKGHPHLKAMGVGFFFNCQMHFLFCHVLIHSEPPGLWSSHIMVMTSNFQDKFITFL